MIQQPRNPRYRSLDVWRGVACLQVLLYHSVFQGPHFTPDTPNAGGWTSLVASRMWIGVPLFFVISGYCISAAADASRTQPRPVRRYFLRRFRRIYPPAWAVLIASVGIVILVDVLLCPELLSRNGIFYRPWWFSGWQWLGNLTLTETWRFHLVGGPKGLFLGHYWTLCYEEQFYAVMGLLLLAAPKRLFPAVVGVTILSLLAATVLPRWGLPVDGYFFDGNWALFAAGILVYYCVNYASRRGQVAASMFLLVAVGGSLLQPQRLLEVEKNFTQEVFVAASFALLLVFLHKHDELIMSTVWVRPLAAAGKICYSLYLVHLPVVRLFKGACVFSGYSIEEVSPVVSIPVCTAASLVCAVLFYETVERRFLNASSPGRRTSQVTPVGVSPQVI